MDKADLFSSLAKLRHVRKLCPNRCGRENQLTLAA